MMNSPEGYKKENENKSIEELILERTRLFNKGGFYLEIRSGAVLPIKHPHYYDGRVDIVLDDHFGKPNCSAKIEKNEYSVNDEQFNEIKQLIKDNFNLLFEIAKKQTDEMYSGTYNSMLIKFNSVLLNISPDNVTNEHDFKAFNELKSTIMDIIIPKNEEEIEKTINDLVNKVIALPIGTETSICKLLGDKIREFNIDQLFQIYKRFFDICKERGIIFNFGKYKEQGVGLPFNMPFIISEK